MKVGSFETKKQENPHVEKITSAVVSKIHSIVFDAIECIWECPEEALEHPRDPQDIYDKVMQDALHRVNIALYPAMCAASRIKKELKEDLEALKILERMKYA